MLAFRFEKRPIDNAVARAILTVCAVCGLFAGCGGSVGSGGGGANQGSNENANDNADGNGNSNNNTNDNADTNDNANENLNDNAGANENVNTNDNVNENINDNSSDNMNENMSPPGCTATADCSSKQLCREGECVPLPELTAELGYTDPGTGQYTPVEAGTPVPFYAGFQGLSELFVTVRVSGLAQLDLQTPIFEIGQTVRMADSGFVIHEFTQAAVVFESLSADEAELAERRMILDAAFSTLDGQEVDVLISLAMTMEGRTISAAIDQRMTLALVR